MIGRRLDNPMEIRSPWSDNLPPEILSMISGRARHDNPEEIRSPWSDNLPPEILSMISGRLDNPMEIEQFRSVCRLWRSSIPPRHRQNSRIAFPIPCPRSTNPFFRSNTSVFLCWSTVYVLETPEGTAFGPARWLLKLGVVGRGRMGILSLFSQEWIAPFPDVFPRVLDLRQCRVVEICREYTLDYDSRTGGLLHVEGIRKVVMQPDCEGPDFDRCSVYIIHEDGLLGYWKYGNRNWSHLARPQDFAYDDQPQHFAYNDIAVYDDNVCAVDDLGVVWEIDSSFCLQPFTPSIYGSDSNHRPRGNGCRKYLVVSTGDLYVVDKYIRYGANAGNPFNTVYGRMADFGVYRWDRRRGRWEEMRSLGNSAFFLSKHRSFAIPACELGRGHGNCIYYAEEAVSIFSTTDVKVFTLADRNIKYLDFNSTLGMVNISRLE